MHVIPEATTTAAAATPEAAIPEAAPEPSTITPPGKMRFSVMLRPHWKAFVLACVAVVGETIADIAEPWPVKIIVDNVLRDKALPPWLASAVAWIGQDRIAILNFALGAVLMIAVVGAISSYFEKYLTTTVGQWVSHDLRLLLYQRIQRLSLLEHGESRSGDLISRVTSDIDAIQDFIMTALLGCMGSCTGKLRELVLPVMSMPPRPSRASALPWSLPWPPTSVENSSAEPAGLSWETKASAMPAKAGWVALTSGKLDEAVLPVTQALPEATTAIP